MTDYYQLLTRAIASLDKSTGESRRALYGHARAALVKSLGNLSPRLSESEITRERLLLEQAIREVEAEAMRPPPVKVQQATPIANAGLEQGGQDEKPAVDGDHPTASGQEPALCMPLPEPASQPVASADASPEVEGDVSADVRPEVKTADTSADWRPDLKGGDTTAERGGGQSPAHLRDRNPQREAMLGADGMRQPHAGPAARVDPFHLSPDEAIRNGKADEAGFGPGAKRDVTGARQPRTGAAADAGDLDRFRLLLDKAIRCAEGDGGGARPEAKSDGRWPAHVRDGSREPKAVPEPSSTARRAPAGFEPRPEPRGLRMPRRESAPPVSGPHPRTGSRPSAAELRAQQAGPEAAAVPSQLRSKKGRISTFLGMLILLALALMLYWLRDPLMAAFIKKAVAPLQQLIAPLR
jgi:hypothetical protein